MGRRVSQTPRLNAVVDGDTLQLLFDTGATIWLTDAALAQLHDGLPADRATTHVRVSLYEKWHARHPDWRVIEHGDRWSNSNLIEVPVVNVAGFDVGPVLFSALLNDTSSHFIQPPPRMKIDGTLGGSALKYFVVTMDYPNRVAQFATVGR
jgi:hypothetical protein